MSEKDQLLERLDRFETLLMRLVSCFEKQVDSPFTERCPACMGTGGAAGKRDCDECLGDGIRTLEP